MKRLLTYILIAVLILMLAGCGGQQESGQASIAEDNMVTVDSSGTQDLMDSSWQKIADESEIDQYYDNLYGEENTGRSIRSSALELYKAIALEDIRKGENTMISPLSFLSAMGLLENGAKDQTLTEIEEAFGVSIDSFNSWYDAWTKLMMLGGDNSLKNANSVWFRTDPHLRVSEEYLKKTKEIFDAQAYAASFDEETLDDINGWVKENTDGMIPAILDDIPKDAMMFLINATCFEGAWLNEYEDDQIKEGETFTKEDGTKEDATLLYSFEKGGLYFENENLTGTSKDYANGFRISFFLPKEGKTVSDLLDSLEGDDISDIMSEGQTADVHLYIPEFSFDYTAPDCIGALKGMGIETVFDEDMADLSPMAVMDNGYNLSVSEVIHKTRIELDREGTRAAASTAIGIVKNTALMQDVPEKEVRLDRPFIFMISDAQTDTPIFMGNVSGIS